MTAEQKLQWIALPNGLDAKGRPRLAAFVAPRLRTNGNRLGELPDFVDWPAIISAAQWHVIVDGDHLPATVTSPAPDPALWAALFPPDTYLEPFIFDDYADRPLVTFDVGAVSSDLRTLFAQAAVNSAELIPIRTSHRQDPPARALDGLLMSFLEVSRGRLGSLTVEGRKNVVRELLAYARAESASVRASGVRGLAKPIEPLPAGQWDEGTRALFFHTRPESEPVDMLADGSSYRDAIDAHQMLGALGDHPELMRLLGLVVDLVVEDGLPMATANATKYLAVMPTLPVPAQPDGVVRTQLCHRTAYVHDDVSEEDGDHRVIFVAARATPDPTGPAGGVSTGLVPLPESAFFLNQVDVDGALLKMINLAATVDATASSARESPLDQPDVAGLPVPRSRGLALARHERAADLQHRFARAVDHNSIVDQDGEVELHAEDLVRGYRLDVLDVADSSDWRTVHARVLTATAERFGGVLEPMPGEGFFTISLAGAPVPVGTKPDPDGELYVHEVFVTWDGWSLSAPRPGAALNRDPSAPEPGNPNAEPVRVTNDSHTTMGLSLESVVAAGTLPRLRFGHAYRFRLREVDLAGQGPSLVEADTWLDPSNITNLAIPENGAMPYLRFEPVPAPTIIPAQPFAEGASVMRLVVRSDGDMDSADYTVAVAEELAAMDLKPYRDHDDRHLAVPKASFEMVERHGMFDAVMSSDGLSANPHKLAQIRDAYAIARREKGTFDDPDAPGVQLVEIPNSADRPPSRYVVWDTPTVEVPYLPDPLAEGVVFFGLPGAPLEGIRIDTASDRWYEPRSFRLRLTSGAAATMWDEQARMLTVQLPQATSIRVRVASVVNRLDLMGIFNWCEQELTGIDRDAAIQTMKDNRSWLISPWHELELVHAVQRPLVMPNLEHLEATRSEGQTSAELVGVLAVDPASTDTIEIRGRWSEPIDDPDDAAGPRRQAGASAAFSLSMSLIRTMPSDDLNAPFSLLDEHWISFNTIMRVERGTGQPPPHEFGDTKHRMVSYAVTASSAFREYFPNKWIEEPNKTSLTGASVEVDLPSTAPPPQPKVLSVLPTMRWSSIKAAELTTISRLGGGVRVWLGRGWFASGDGELLGVVIGSDVISPLGEDYARISILSADPTRRGVVPENLRPDLFHNATTISGFLPMPGARGKVQAAGYQPAFDPDSDRWYCDIDIDTGLAYQPFLRLALVRYQPSSLPGCHLSAPVMVDIVQTLPDRVATILKSPGADVYDVTVVGPSYDAIAGPLKIRTDPAALARMTVRVQRRDPAIVDHELGWVDDDTSPVEMAVTREQGTATWTAQIKAAISSQPKRLLILEEERWPTDTSVGDAVGLISKVVYAAHIPIA